MFRLFPLSRPLTVADKLWSMPWLTLAAAALLAAAGTAALYSVAGGSYEPWAARHALRFIAMIAAVLCMALVPLRVWLRLSYPFYAVSLLLLAAVPFAGVEALGAKRWLAIGGLTFQPSELMKVALVAALARFYQVIPDKQISRPRNILIAGALILVPVVLTLRQPDLGSAALFVILGAGLMFLAGVSLAAFGAGAMAFGAALPLIASNLHEYQRRRLTSFLDPEADPLGAGYHIMQSKIALGSGGAGGRGFMQGSQSQLDFLPEKHTDFIFTMLGEEWGFAGCVLLLATYAVLLVLLARMAIRARSPHARLVISGALLTIFLYVFINVAMVTGLVPVVGVPLPLVSYGGTSMVTTMVLLALALSAHVHGREDSNRSELEHVRY